MKTILVPVDFTPITTAVLGAAAELGRAPVARLVLLHVLQIPTTLWSFQLAAEEVAGIIAVREKEVVARLAGLKCPLEGFEVEIRAAAGNVVDEILREAKELDASVIVMGAHSHTILYELLHGSTTRAVLARAGCPVVVVPANAEGQETAADRSAEAATIAYCSAVK